MVRITKSGSGKAEVKRRWANSSGRDGFRVQPSFGGGARQFAGGGDDLLLATIVEGEGQVHAGVLGGTAFRIQDHLADVAGHPAAIADDAHAAVALHQLVHIAAEIGAEQSHQGAHFGLGPLPVFRRKGEQGEILKFHVAGGAHRLAHRAHAGIMTGLARQMPFLRPAAIAVHDDGDMAGKMGRMGAQLPHTCMISCSLVWSAVSMSLMCWSVSFCSSSPLV